MTIQSTFYRTRDQARKAAKELNGKVLAKVLGNPVGSQWPVQFEIEGVSELVPFAPDEKSNEETSYESEYGDEQVSSGAWDDIETEIELLRKALLPKGTLHLGHHSKSNRRVEVLKAADDKQVKVLYKHRIAA